MRLNRTQQDTLEQVYWTAKAAPVRVTSRLVPQVARRRARGATRVHLGCGSHLLDGWANLDMGGPAGVIRFDLSRPLPCADASVALIFSEHFVEHLRREDGLKVLRECARILRPGGVLRVSTPDLRTLVEEYLAERVNEWAADGWAPTSPCELVNQGMRLWGHQFLWDEKELAAALTAAGFTTVTRVAWHESQHAALRGLEVRPHHRDLILEATR